MTVSGFKAGAVKAGIRGKDRLDLGLIYSEVPAAAAGVFTTNRVKAAPVQLDIIKLREGEGRAVVVNSGVANACTGAAGLENARKTVSLAAKHLGIAENQVLISSTGVIGEDLDISLFEKAMPSLVAGLRPDGLPDVARAMMTTDTFPKIRSSSLELGGRKVTMTGLAKGSGMIMPHMATMLAFVVTDAAVDSAVLQSVLEKSVEPSFNSITVDGDTSTNDSVLMLANSRAANSVIKIPDSSDAVFFQERLSALLLDLALDIVRDGEGATKLITVQVKGAVDMEEADLAARTIANSSLFKTACFGQDPNWGRIIAALGRSGAQFDPEQVSISFDDVFLVEKGISLDRDVEEKAAGVLRKDSFQLVVDLKEGDSEKKIYTCDLSPDYIRINADYRT
ncbi:MAG: bifunctional glutamate N-acetyltransferase/amino-acid acetyltransferase ArgJ [Thermodesulfobacteriota bacterium]